MPSETIYDHPLYYDILFGWDRTKEAEFYHRVFERCGIPSGGRILEVACATGQVARRLAQRGWAVAGLDVRPSMVAFLRERAAVDGIRVETFCGDMTTFSTESNFAAAYNPMSSFRLLHSDAAAEAHLRAMAAMLRSGGIYVLDMEFLSSAGEPAITVDDSWVMERGSVVVRAEDDAVHVNDDGIEHVLPWSREAHLRGYTSAAFVERLDATDGLQIEAWHPEVDRGSGVSEFDVDETATPPVVGRAMVVLRSD